MIIPRKKKLRSEKEVKQRFYFSLGLIGFMMAVVMIAPLLRKNKNKQQDAEKTRLEKIMNRQLDSIITGSLPFTINVSGMTLTDTMYNASVLQTGEIETVPVNTYYQEKFSLAQTMLELAVQSEDTKATPDTARIMRLYRECVALKDSASIERRTSPIFYVRNISLRHEDGREIVGYQKTDNTLRSSSVSALMERISPDQLQNLLKKSGPENIDFTKY